MKKVNVNGEVFSYWITNEFGGNHILHLISSKRGKLEVWWGSYEPTPQDMCDLFDQFRGKIGA